MIFELKGKVHYVSPTSQVSDKFKKRDLVLYVENENKPEFSDFILFEAIQDGCDKLNNIQDGQDLVVKFFIGGREWTKDGKTRYFNTLKIADVIANTGNVTLPPPPPQQQPQTNAQFDQPGVNDGLPF
jgi:hypothetical protein